jgi:hypothetical protein
MFCSEKCWQTSANLAQTSASSFSRVGATSGSTLSGLRCADIGRPRCRSPFIIRAPFLSLLCELRTLELAIFLLLCLEPTIAIGYPATQLFVVFPRV